MPPAVPDFDLYRELEVDPRASRETIEAAFRSLAKRFHPDTGGGRAHTARMSRINQAYELLRDPALRAEYDRRRTWPDTAVPTMRPPQPTQPEPARRHSGRASSPGLLVAVGVVLLAAALAGLVVARGWPQGSSVAPTPRSRVPAAVETGPPAPTPAPVASPTTPPAAPASLRPPRPRVPSSTATAPDPVVRASPAPPRPAP